MNRLPIFLIILIVILCGALFYYVNKTKILEEKLDKVQLEQKTQRDSLESKKAQSFLPDFLKFADEFDSLKAVFKIESEKITLTQAQPYYNNFLNSRAVANKTEAILFEWRDIIKSMITSYDVQPEDWVNLDYWDDKGFVAFPANYGSTGDKNGHFKHHTSVIIQIAKKDVSTPNQDDWITVDNEMFDFGDIKPPKTINGQNPK